MINQTIDKLTLAILAAAALGLQAGAAEKKTTAPAVPMEKSTAATTTAGKPAAAKEAADKSFGGVISDVDKNGKTITVSNKKGGNPRTFNIGDTAKLTKGGKKTSETATWDDLAVGGKVHGTFTKTADGKMDVTTLKVGGKSEAKKEAAEATDAKPAASAKP